MSDARRSIASLHFASSNAVSVAVVFITSVLVEVMLTKSPTLSYLWPAFSSETCFGTFKM